MMVKFLMEDCSGGLRGLIGKNGEIAGTRVAPVKSRIAAGSHSGERGSVVESERGGGTLLRVGTDRWMCGS